MQSRAGVVGLMLTVLGCGRVGYGAAAASAPGLDAASDGAAADAGAGGPSAWCGNRLLEGSEVCDDGNSADGDGCSGDCTRNELCGDGIVVGAAEVCDDGNSTNGDGCDNDCTFSCTAHDECDDGEACNGSETCSAAHACAVGSALPDATSCGVDRACRLGTCAPLGCGDMIVAPAEECDDGNTVSNDGCENDCTFSCATAADCDDADDCTGIESCDPATHTCTPGSSLADGAPCDRDSNPATRDVCLAGACAASRCGDGYVDLGRGEDCDDLNAVNGDGCENDCTFSCATPADCDDGLVCNGDEQCDTEHRCVAGSPAADGTTCLGGMCSGGLCLLAGTDGGILGGTMCGTARCEICCCATTSSCAPRMAACPDVICQPEI